MPPQLHVVDEEDDDSNALSRSWRENPLLSKVGRIHRVLDKKPRAEQIKVLRAVCVLLDINVHFDGD